MTYQQLTDEGQKQLLEQRILEVERSHYNATVELRLAEQRGDDQGILEWAQRIESIDQTLSLLYGQ